MKRLIAILLACALAVQPVYADNGKMGKRQKTPEEAAQDVFVRVRGRKGQEKTYKVRSLLKRS